MKVVDACLRIILQCHPKWWAMENPVGYLREYMGKPELTFQPWEYGDPWTKRTDIWGSFTIPQKKYKNWEDVPNKLPLYTRPGRGKPNFAYLHKSAHPLIPQLSWAHPVTDAEFRAITPPAFAKAFSRPTNRKFDGQENRTSVELQWPRLRLFCMRNLLKGVEA